MKKVKTKYGKVYTLLECPNCGHDFTVAGGVEIEAVRNNGDRLGTFGDKLIPHGPHGVLADMDGWVEAGKHSETTCGRCRETLTHHEVGFEWTDEDGYEGAKNAALAEATEG